MPLENGTPEPADRFWTFDNVAGPSNVPTSLPDGELHITALVSCLDQNSQVVWLGGETLPVAEPSKPCSGWQVEQRPGGFALKRVFCGDRDPMFLGHIGDQLVFRESAEDELKFMVFADDSHYTFFASKLHLWLAVECTLPVLKPTATKLKLELLGTETPKKVTWTYFDAVRRFFRDAIHKLSDWWSRTGECVGAFLYWLGPGVLVVAFLGVLLGVMICIKCGRNHDESRRVNEA